MKQNQINALSDVASGKRKLIGGKQLCNCRPPAKWHGDEPGPADSNCGQCHGTGWLDVEVIGAPLT